MMEDLELNFPKSDKLVLTLEAKSNYVVHYKNLQFYLSQEMRLKKSPPGDRVRPGAVDEALYPDEHRVHERSEE